MHPSVLISFDSRLPLTSGPTEWRFGKCLVMVSNHGLLSRANRFLKPLTSPITSVSKILSAVPMKCTTKSCSSAGNMNLRTDLLLLSSLTYYRRLVYLFYFYICMHDSFLIFSGGVTGMTYRHSNLVLLLSEFRGWSCFNFIAFVPVLFITMKFILGLFLIVQLRWSVSVVCLWTYDYSLQSLGSHYFLLTSDNNKVLCISTLILCLANVTLLIFWPAILHFFWIGVKSHKP